LAALLVDFDNNSWKDLMVTNGFKRDTRNRDWMNELEVRYETEGVTGSVLYDQLQKSNSTPIANYIFKNRENLSGTYYIPRYWILIKMIINFIPEKILVRIIKILNL